MAVSRGVKLNHVHSGINDKELKMTEATNTQWIDFNKAMRDLFNKHLDKFVAANKCLEQGDLDGFHKTYEDKTKEDLIEMVKAQHISYNMLFSQYELKSKQVIQIMKQISQATTPEEINQLRKMADTTLMAQNMVDNGKSPEEIKKALEGEQSKVFHNDQSIIVTQ